MLNKYVLIGLFGGLASLLVFTGLYSNSYIGHSLEQRLISDYSTQEMTISKSISSSVESRVKTILSALEVAAVNEDVISSDPNRCNEALDQIIRQSEVHAGNIGRVNTSGIFYCSVNRKIIGTSTDKYGDYVTRLINDPEHNPTSSRAVQAPGVDGYLTAIHIPVYTKQGAFAGTVGGAIYLNQLAEEIMDNVQLLEGGNVFMQDDNGDILFAESKSYIGKNYFSQEVQAANGVVDLNAAIRGAHDGEDKTVRYTYNGVERMAAITSFEVTPGHRWIIGVNVPVSSLQQVYVKSGLRRAFTTLAVVIAMIIVILTALLLIGIPIPSTGCRVNGPDTGVESEKKEAEALLGSIGDGVIAMDTQWKITLINEAATELVGVTREQAMGVNFKDIMPLIRERDREPYYEFIENAVTNGKTYHITEKVLLVRKDGSEFPIGDSAAPIINSSGKTTGAIIVFRDLTEELEEGKLKSEFSYASHQFLTPISQISAALSSALQEKSVSAMREDIRFAQLAMQSIKRMSSHLVEVSEIDQATLSVIAVQIDAMAVVNETIKEFEDEAKRRKVTITLETGNRKTLSMKTDPEKIRKILLELIENAILYSAPKQRVTIKVGKLGDQLAIEVQSHGPAISEEDLPLIFTKFFRGSNKTLETPGAGLGLYIAKSYTEILLGKIWFNSTVDRTTFFITLPMNQA